MRKATADGSIAIGRANRSCSIKLSPEIVTLQQNLLLCSFLALTFVRRSAFGGGLFPVALRMNAEIAP